MKAIDQDLLLLKTEDDTRALGFRIAEALEPGDVVALIGDLGTGKTALTKYIAEGLGVTEEINSPTFTIIQEYDTGRIPLYHFDVYRIADIEEMYEIGFEEYIYGDGVCLIEWANLISELLPENIISVDISKALDKGFDYRKTITSLNVPVYFISGDTDYNCPWPLAEEYCRIVDAPDKGFFKIPDSAHSPLWENPGVTCGILRQIKEKTCNE